MPGRGDAESDMDRERETLCYFEYYDRRGSRNHLCLVCADCEVLDKVVDGCIRGRKPTDEQLTELKADVVDRLRVPAYGGARRLNLNLLIPNLIIGFLLFVGSYHILLTVASPILFNVFMAYCYRKWRTGKVDSLMFFSWGPSCLCWLYIIAVLYEAPHCSTQCVAAVHLLFVVFLVSMWRTRTVDPGKIAPRYSTTSESGLFVALPVGVCTHCGAVKKERSKHCRLNCCIAAGNHRWFLATVVCLAGLGVVFVALGLHSDCADPSPVFDGWHFRRGWQCWKNLASQSRSSVLLTTSVFVALGAVIVTMMFLQQLLMISADVTYHQSLQAQRQGHNIMWLLRRLAPLQVLHHWKLFFTGWPEDSYSSATETI